MHKSSSFFIIKVRYTFLCNFFPSEPISIIFDDYESWDLALSETLESGEFWAEERVVRVVQSSRSAFGSVTNTPSTHRKRGENRRNTDCIMDVSSGIENKTNETASCKFSTSNLHFCLSPSHKNENPSKYQEWKLLRSDSQNSHMVRILKEHDIF